MTPETWIELARLSRAGLPESSHRGAWVLKDCAGRTIDGRGDPEQRIWTRSAVKALQALPLVAMGLLEVRGLDDRHLAVICGSHSGESRHRELVREILSAAGFSERDLGCGYHRPFDGAAAREQIREDLPDSPLYHNCSGKHAGMLLLDLAHGGKGVDYLDPDAAGQRLIRGVLKAFSGGEAPEVGIDGCNAPSFRLSLGGLARAFAHLAAGTLPPGLPRPDLDWQRALDRVVAAQLEYSELVGGRRKRLDSALIAAGAGGILAKSGAEGVEALALRAPGLGLAIKVADGGERVVGPLCCALLERWKILGEKDLDSLAYWGDAAQINAAGRVTGALEILPRALPTPGRLPVRPNPPSKS